ncbi:MAG: sortase [Clostridia bacterium]|nr:sortase [Clostridia bacterium]
MEGRDRTGSPVGRGVALTIPFLLFFAGIFCLSMYLFQTVVEESAYFGLLVGRNAQTEVADEDTGFIPSGRPNALSEIPSIPYGKQFARINVTWDGGGWTIKNIPVFLGADKKLLKKGAGMSFGSSFPGEGGCTIISAHVTRDFAQLEDTPTGAVVLVETSYGPYAYRVREMKTAKGTDRWFMDAGQKTDLVLYTCYPRDNGGKRRTDRCILLCDLIDGAEVGR